MRRIAIVALALAMALCMFGCDSGKESAESSSVDKAELIEMQRSLIEMNLDEDTPPGIAAEVYIEEIANDLTDTSLTQSDVDRLVGTYAQLIDQNITSKLDSSSGDKTKQDEKTSQYSSATISQQNALKTAKSYLDISAFSYSGLIEQLEYEKFSTEDATYGADNCGADWNEQAAKMAESYLDISSFSRDGLIEQLEYEGYTHDQAVYGVDSVGL